MKHLASNKSTSSLSEFESSQVQPNAIDLKVKNIYKIHNNEFIISESTKVHRKTEELPLETSEDFPSGRWYLKTGTYEIIFEGEVTIGPDEAGWVITRSTLNRNGLFLTSGLYDSGYKGVMAGALHVNCGGAYIVPGTRLGQFILFKAESLNQYDGSYGTGKEHDKKYKEK